MTPPYPQRTAAVPGRPKTSTASSLLPLFYLFDPKNPATERLNQSSPDSPLVLPLVPSRASGTKFLSSRLI